MGARKKILILTADAGFGHRAAANAMNAALSERYGDACEIVISNPINDPRTPSVLRKTQDEYDRQVNQMRDLYRLAFRVSDWDLPVSFAEAGLILMLQSVLRELLSEHQPDVIVSTHLYYQAALAAVFALNRCYIPLLAVVTDLATVHTLWFNDSVDLYAVPTGIVAKKAREHGIPAERIQVTGLPVNPALALPTDKNQLRDGLGWGKDRHTVLMVGGTRVKKIEAVAQALNHSALPLQLALVAGGDDGLFARWQAVDWHLPTHVYGFMKDMPTLMQAADMIVCKAGGLIVSEALAAGLPLLLVEAIPGQETGNADYVIGSGAGEMASSPLQALACVLHWLDRDGALLAERAANARTMGRPQAAYRIADLIWRLVRAEGIAQSREHRLLAQASQLREMLARLELVRSREKGDHHTPLEGQQPPPGSTI
jgi:1,2-diacylglycerol 3-beta-galactosyltransferase